MSVTCMECGNPIGPVEHLCPSSPVSPPTMETVEAWRAEMAEIRRAREDLQIALAELGIDSVCSLAVTGRIVVGFTPESAQRFAGVLRGR